MATFVPLLSRAQIEQLPDHAREVVEYRKRGLSLNHIQGCPLDCPYCIRHTYGLWDQRQPRALMSDAEAINALMGHRCFQPHITPVQVFNRATNPFLPDVRPHTFAVLEDLDERGLTNHVLVIIRHQTWVVALATTRGVHGSCRVRCLSTPCRQPRSSVGAMNATYAPNPGHAVASSPRVQPPANDLTLIALHMAIRFSGLFTKFTAQRWGFRHLSDAGERIAVELIARAVETTGNPDPNPRYTDLDELYTIGIRVSRKDNGLLIEVWDSDTTPPQESYLDDHLSTVAEINHQWNCYQPHNGGKVILAELAVSQERKAGEQRTTGLYSYPEPETPVEPLQNTALMRRVLDGLHRLDSRVLWVGRCRS